MQQDDIFGLQFRQYLTTRRLGRILRSLDQVDSTNRLAQSLASEGAPEGTVVWARHQTSGRGRLGRSWSSPAGKGLWFSIVLTPAVSPATVSQIPLVAAVAVARSVVRVTQLTPRIKWPNDIMIGRRKVCGILAESRVQGDTLEYVILGIGLNTNATAGDFPPELTTTATSLFLETGKPVDDIALLANILNEIELWYDLWLERGFGPIQEAWQAQNSSRPASAI
ncbi:MAG TPA: biotin--[acetyl-CoA-carboxylase] ligase [Firmicutes bacterium]|nr:biotin--[acetyl-CoA-carboxylase] ligase [Bacillota bacterium]